MPSSLVHALYSQWQETWEQLFDIYEGGGGFLDVNRPYLLAHPREFLDHTLKDPTTGALAPNPSPSDPSPKLRMRRKLARHEEWGCALVDVLRGSLFSDPPARTMKSTLPETYPLRRFWRDADGKGAPIDGVLSDAWIVAAVFGHCVIVSDAPTAATGETAASAPLSRLCLYTPLDMPDWLTDDTGKLTAVKLTEVAPRADMTKRETAANLRYRVITETDVTVYDRGMKVVTPATPHGFGRLPVTVLYGRRRPLTAVIGKSVMGAPRLYLDLYNLISEVRELLRNQTFALLNIPMGEKGDVLAEQQKAGSQSGTATALFTTFPANFISPSADNVTVYHAHIDRLLRTIYRLAGVPFEADSRDAESAESRRLKREELRTLLTGFAAELARADTDITELHFRRTYQASWETERANADVSVQYPKDFTLPDFEALLATTAEAIALDLGETATKALKKSTVRVVLPDADEQTLADADQEIDAMKVQTAEEKQAEMLKASAAKMTAAGKPKIPAAPATVQ